MSLSNAHLDNLPSQARELVALIGLPATLRLVEAYGGQALDIPRGKRRRGIQGLQTIAERVGIIAAKKIAGHYAGTVLYVPKCADALRIQRDAELQARFDALTAAGLSARAAVRHLITEHGLVASSIWRALKRPVSTVAVTARTHDDRQAGLFD